MRSRGTYRDFQAEAQGSRGRTLADATVVAWQGEHGQQRIVGLRLEERLAPAIAV